MASGESRAGSGEEGLSSAVPLAVSYRGTVAEAVHYGHVAVTLPSGEVVGGLGEAEVLTTLRSAAKPLQGLSVVTSGAAERFRLEARHLAIICASHQGAALHQAAVREILARLELDESYLDCGAHWPDDREERERLICAGLAPTAIHNNCSGKHAGMLATALALGASPRGYLDPAHPVQALIRRHLARMAGVPEEGLVALIDGCGAPTYALPLRSVATAFARLASPPAPSPCRGGDSEGTERHLPEDLQAAARRLTGAMIAFPEMVQGPGSFNTALLREMGGNVVAKGGAEGLFALGLPGSGLGLAVKVSDGSTRPWPPVVLALLRRLLPLPPVLETWARPEEVNCHGTVVGYVEATAEVSDLQIQSPPAEGACL